MHTYIHTHTNLLLVSLFKRNEADVHSCVTLYTHTKSHIMLARCTIATLYHALI